MTPASADDLVSHAHATRVVVIGGGLAGLVAAWECAKVGMSVTVLERQTRVGGAIESAGLDGTVIDVGVDAFTPGRTAFDALLTDLGLADSVVESATTDCLLATDAGVVPIPADTILGIPANAWADDVRRIIGWRGAWRAYVDRLRPPLTIGREERLDALVRSRVGDRIADRLVAPIARGVYGAPLAVLDTDAAVPGLSTALTRAGSLGGAVAQLRADVAALPPRASLEGGMTGLVDALVQRLGDLDVDLRLGTRAASVERHGTGWRVHLDDVTGDADPRADSSADSSGDLHLDADVLLIATPAAVTAELLGRVAPAVSDAARAAAPGTAELVTLVVDAPHLEGATRWRAVFATPVADGPSVLAHATAEWAWLAGAVAPGTHVLRVAFDAAPTATPAPDAGTAPAPGSDEQTIARAADAARQLTGGAVDVRAATVTRRDASLPASALGHAAATAAVRDAAHALPGLGVVGSWLAGAEPADVVADALDEAERLRRTALWGPDTAQSAR